MNSKSEQILLSKIECAKRFFIEAVVLFFEKRDPVAIHHLAHASHEMLNKLTEKSNILDKSSLNQEGLKIFKNAFLSSKNFIKHADKNQVNALFDFNPDLNIFVLLDCAIMLCKLLGDDFFPGKVFISWCTTTEPKLFTEDFLYRVNQMKCLGYDHRDLGSFVSSIKYWRKIQKD